MRDQKKFSSLKASLVEMADKIASQQGFTKNLEDIKLCINCLDSGFVPKSKIKGLVKPTRKLHYSLQLYLWRSGLIHRPIRTKYANIFHDYKLLEEDRKLLNTKADISEIISVNVPDNCVTAVYKSKTIKTFQEEREEGDLISSRFRNRANKIVRERPGIKKVNKNIDFHVKLKKKYKVESELDDDLYRIFSSWYQGKISSHEHHVSLHNKFANVLHNYSQLRENRAQRRYFLTKELLMKYVGMRKGSPDKIPKRFLKITKLLSCIKNDKWIQNDSVVEKIVSQVSVVSTKEDSGVYRRTGDCCLYTASKQVFKWLNMIFLDLKDRGYLTVYDIPKTKKRIRGARFECDPITNYHHSKMWHDKCLMRKFRKRKDKFYLGLKNILLADIHETYVRLNYDELDFFDYINNKTREIKKVVSSEEFKEFLRLFHQPRVGLAPLTSSFLRMLGMDDKVKDYLEPEDEVALFRGGLVNPHVEYANNFVLMSDKTEYQARLWYHSLELDFEGKPSQLAQSLMVWRRKIDGVIDKIERIKQNSKKDFEKDEWTRVKMSIVKKEVPYGLDLRIALADFQEFWEI
jgi:hypothetical protein